MPIPKRTAKPSSPPWRRLIAPAGAALATGAAAVVGAAVRRRSGGPSSSETPPAPPAENGPDVSVAPANYDVSGPPANTATPLASTPTDAPAAPDSGFDEEAEVAAAAADAAAIGGAVPEYASSREDELADPSEAPLIEAGEGVSEGMEQAEADLLDEVTDPYGPGAGMTDAEVQIERAIEEQDDPFAGEREDVVPPGSEDAGPANAQ